MNSTVTLLFKPTWKSLAVLQLGHFKDEEIISIPSIRFRLHTGYLGVLINPHICPCFPVIV